MNPQIHDHTRMNEHDTERKICKQCGEPFSPNAEHQKFCGTKCHDLYWRKIRRIARDLAERGLA